MGLRQMGGVAAISCTKQAAGGTYMQLGHQISGLALRAGRQSVKLLKRAVHVKSSKCACSASDKTFFQVSKGMFIDIHENIYSNPIDD